MYTTYSNSVYTISEPTAVADLAGAIFAAMAMFALPILAISILIIVAEWKIFKKAGKPGWAALIPVYNTWIFFEAAGLEGALSLICLPFPPFIYYGIYKLCKTFGKSTGFFVASIFFLPISIMILGFGKSQPQAQASQQYTQPTQPQYAQPTQPQYTQPAQPEQPVQPQYTQPTQPQVPTDSTPQSSGPQQPQSF